MYIATDYRECGNPRRRDFFFLLVLAGLESLPSAHIQYPLHIIVRE